MRVKRYITGRGMRFSWDIQKECPDFKYFRVGIGYTKTEVFATLENSLGFHSIQHFCPNHDMHNIESIEVIGEKDFCIIDSAFCGGLGICFAETGLRYSFKERDKLKEDYFIVKLAGITTRRS